MNATTYETCVGTARHTGQRCKRMPIPGATVCKFHGGMAPQVLRKAAERIAIKEAMERGDRRPPWTILLDALHASDVLMRDAVTSLGESGSVTTEQIDKLTESFERAARLSKVVIDSGALQMLIEKEMRQGDELANTFLRMMTAVEERAGLTEEQLDTVRAIMRAELKAELEKDDTTGSAKRPAIEGQAA